MKSIWLTYAWDDNKDGDVDFTAQELGRVGLEVKLDRWNLTAGKRLWEQIESFIQDPSRSDGWMLYATQTSLGSQACREEFAFALDRALHTRGGDFPVIALFPSPVDSSLIPAGIKTRLYVNLTDPDWKKRIVAAVENRQPDIIRPNVEPFALKIHQLGERDDGKRYAIEVRPRAGTWAPFMIAIPLTEKDSVALYFAHGPANRIPEMGALWGTGESMSDDGEWLIKFALNEATPTQSYFIFCSELPSTLCFGVHNGQPQYRVNLTNQ